MENFNQKEVLRKAKKYASEMQDRVKHFSELKTSNVRLTQ
jgi:hypothetical protein